MYIYNYPTSPLFDRESLMEEHLYCERKYQENCNILSKENWPSNSDSLPICPISPVNSASSNEMKALGTERMDRPSLVTKHKRKIPQDSAVQPKVIRYLENISGPSKANDLLNTFTVPQDLQTIAKFELYYSLKIPLSSGEEYCNWKCFIRRLFTIPITALTEGFTLALKTLNDATYTIGASSKCKLIVNRSDKGCPSCPAILGVLSVPENENGPFYITIHKDLFFGGKRVQLIPDLTLQLTDNIHISVSNFFHLFVYDTKRPAYTNVYNQKDIFLPYDDSLIFKATVKNATKVEVENFEEDETFKVFHDESDGTWQFHYVDPITIKQRLYPLRGVYLHPIGGNGFILNFNFSFPRFVADKHKSSVNYLKKEILAGVDYELF
ncbi:hypothetical protein HDV06_001497 [Boothiomyces sp. JEL0866]|nr:hypothetical protein HDV06_001497 [Boothiomyces sp. JEL0866]